MTVPVCWLSLHLDDAEPKIARGYWDQAWLEALTARRLWTPPGFPDFEHHEGDLSCLPSEGGAVVVLPARWHSAPEDVERLCEALGRLPWVILILCGDEEGEFPIHQFSHPNAKVWLQTPHPMNRQHADRVIGDWWPPQCRPLFAAQGEQERHLGWFFAGNLNNERRVECLEVLRRHQNERGDGMLKLTRVFGSGFPYPEYLRCMASAKVAPCPAGSYSPDTFRVYEALEAGCVPVVDRWAPRTPDERDYWQTLFHVEPPFPILDAWSEFDAVCDEILGDWQTWANRCGSWWEQEQRLTAWDLLDDLRAVGAI